MFRKLLLSIAMLVLSAGAAAQTNTVDVSPKGNQKGNKVVIKLDRGVTEIMKVMVDDKEVEPKKTEGEGTATITIWFDNTYTKANTVKVKVKGTGGAPELVSDSPPVWSVVD